MNSSNPIRTKLLRLPTLKSAISSGSSGQPSFDSGVQKWGNRIDHSRNSGLASAQTKMDLLTENLSKITQQMAIPVTIQTCIDIKPRQQQENVQRFYKANTGSLSCTDLWSTNQRNQVCQIALRNNQYARQHQMRGLIEGSLKSEDKVDLRPITPIQEVYEQYGIKVLQTRGLGFRRRGLIKRVNFPIPKHESLTDHFDSIVDSVNHQKVQDQKLNDRLRKFTKSMNSTHDTLNKRYFGKNKLGYSQEVEKDYNECDLTKIYFASSGKNNAKNMAYFKAREETSKQHKGFTISKSGINYK